MNNPAEEADFRGRVQKLEGLLCEIEAFVDPVARNTALEAVQTLMEFHGAAVAKIDRAHRRHRRDPGDPDPAGKLSAMIWSAACCCSTAFIPADFETRVRQALDKVRPAVKSHGGSIELLGITDGVVRLRVERSGHGCGSTAGKIKNAIDEAIFERAPEVTAIEIEGLLPPPSSGFVPVEQLLGHRNGQSKTKTGECHDSQTAAASGTR